MNTCITESEISQLFKGRERENFELLQTTKKITFEFHVNIDGRDRFLELAKVVSSIEFMVDADLNNIWIKEYSDYVVLRIKVSGTKEALNDWNNNLCRVAKALRGNYGIVHFRNINEQKN